MVVVIPSKGRPGVSPLGILVQENPLPATHLPDNNQVLGVRQCHIEHATSMNRLTKDLFSVIGMLLVFVAVLLNSFPILI